MVEINNQRKAFLDMLAWSEGKLQRTSENQKSWLWRHCRRRAIYWPDHPRKLVTLNPKLNQQAPDATSFFPVGGCLPQAAWSERLLSEKSGTLHCSRLRGAWRFYLWLIVVDIRQVIDRCSNIWASLPGAGYGQFEHKADSLIAKFKEAGGTVREIDVWQSHRDYLRSGCLHHRLPVMGC